MQILEKQPKSRQNNLWQALALRGGSLLQTLPLPDSCDRQNIPVKRTIPLPFYYNPVTSRLTGHPLAGIKKRR